MLAVKSFFMNYGTPLTLGLFLVSAVSGVALYFHVGTTTFREMHEVLSMVLLVPVVVHLWRNWGPFLAYFRRSAMPIALVLCFAASVYYALAAQNAPATGGNPAFALIGAIQKAPLSALAPALSIGEEELVKRLEAGGFAPVDSKDSVGAIATRSGRDRLEVFAALMKPATK